MHLHSPGVESDDIAFDCVMNTIDLTALSYASMLHCYCHRYDAWLLRV